MCSWSKLLGTFFTRGCFYCASLFEDGTAGPSYNAIMIEATKPLGPKQWTFSTSWQQLRRLASSCQVLWLSSMCTEPTFPMVRHDRFSPA